jgi:EmrB/QacA subfamily drug resistance transporter
MISGMIHSLTGSMTRVALPVIRDHFQIQADMTAWVAAIFTLPWVILMPVYGRLSDGLGKRHLILVGVFIYSIGILMTLLSPSLGWLMIGRAIQGIGLAGMMPMSMALISSIFPTSDRGKALGIWGSVGPTTGFVSPLFAGFLVAAGGWRAAFVPPMLVGIIAFFVVYKGIPPGLSAIFPNFLRRFDWVGVILLMVSVTCLVFYVSSRPITGVASLQDWRLLTVSIVLLGVFGWWEKRRKNPFVSFDVFRDRLYSRATVCAAMRMMVMGGLSFLIPLYLVDIHDVNLTQLGGLLMINPGVMAFTVRFGGRMADRWGNRWLAITGLVIQGSVMFIFSQLSAAVSVWVVALTLAYYGLGAGLMLVALHHASMQNISAEQVGMAAGLYSMLRFLGVVIGTALAGVILQYYLDLSIPAIEAYQKVFLFYVGFSILGVIVGLGLVDRSKAGRRSSQEPS